MSLTKIVDGVPVTLSAQEEAATLIEWASAQAAAAIAATVAARLAVVDTTIAADSTVQLLKEMTAAEFDTWWTANVTNLAQANNVLKRIARIVIRRLT